MRQCVFVIGTRAQLVKVAPVLNEAHQSGLAHSVWMTGQHDESIDDLVDDFGIQSEFVRPAQRKERSSILRLLGWLPGALIACRRHLIDVANSTGARPVTIVHGDTLSTFMGALAAWLAGSELVHLESGLSSGSIGDPFPEELLRRLTFRLTDLALCPNDEACERMRRYRRIRVINTGENTLLDCVRLAIDDARAPGVDTGEPYFVASLHRFQNIYQRARLETIVTHVIELSGLSPVYFILHPPTVLRLKKYGLYERLVEAPGVKLRPRMPYTEFLVLVAAARGVISDGGSNQEELAYLGVPTVLIRERTERPDGLGANVILWKDHQKSLATFVRTGAMDELRRDSRIHDAVQPSRIVVEALLALAEDE